MAFGKTSSHLEAFSFSITMISFGIDHFLYTEGIATLVPAWIPNHIFLDLFCCRGINRFGYRDNYEDLN